MPEEPKGPQKVGTYDSIELYFDGLSNQFICDLNKERLEAGSLAGLKKKIGNRRRLALVPIVWLQYNTLQERNVVRKEEEAYYEDKSKYSIYASGSSVRLRPSEKQLTFIKEGLAALDERYKAVAEIHNRVVNDINVQRAKLVSDLPELTDQVFEAERQRILKEQKF